MKQRSVFSTILFPLLMLVVAEAFVFALVLFASGLPARLAESDKVFFAGSVANRARYVETVLRRSEAVSFPLSGEEAHSILPDEELGFDDAAFYLICTGSEVLPDRLPEGELTVRGATAKDRGSGVVIAGDTVRLRTEDDEDRFLVAGGEVYYVAGEVLQTEGLFAPEEAACLLGCVRTDALYGYSTRIKRLLTLTILLILVTGALGAVLIARRVAKPVVSLSEEIIQSQQDKRDIPYFSQTGVAEIDQFAGTITAMARDMDRQRQLEKKRIEHERDFDALTGLMNQTAFLQSCARIFSTPDFIGHAAVLMLDLDDVKVINDTYGHAAGDTYIRTAAKTFADSAPPNALISKVAGDEFYMLYYGFRTAEELEDQINMLRTALAEATVPLPGNETGTLGVTGGAAFYPEDGRSHTELMKSAEFQAYQSKQRQKGQITRFDRESFAKSHAEVKRREDMQALLKDHSLVVYHFMPIFSAHSGEVKAYEALMRTELAHLKNPADILELARQEDCIAEIERIVWERGLACYRELLLQGKAEEDAMLLLNSVSSICLPEEEMERVAEEHGDLIGRVVIEITEAEQMDEEATRKKRAIPGFSGSFALDDYGSGYNSEKTLLELSPKYIKTDMSIIRNIDSSPDKQRIISNIVEYAHERDMLIIAEGIETPSEMQTVCELGVDLLQGFYLAKEAKVPPPLSREASDFLDRNQTEE